MTTKLVPSEFRIGVDAPARLGEYELVVEDEPIVEGIEIEVETEEPQMSTKQSAALEVAFAKQEFRAAMEVARTKAYALRRAYEQFAKVK
jgi:hypothetical protein